jgi:hypothetical protein
MLYQQSQSLANEYPRLWSAAAATGTWRTTAADPSNLTKLSWTSDEIDGVIEGCKILRSPGIA